jgi:Gpi18-like mannosyltransferase
MAIQLFKKGSDLPSMLNIMVDYSKVLCFESAVFSLIMGIPLDCLCIALLLKLFSIHTENQDNIDLE